MPAPELGTKQVCPTCQSKFYDLNRRPAHCPKCGSDFDPEEALRSRKVVRGGRAYEAEEAEDQVKDKSEDAEEEEEEEAATPEIDEAADEPVLIDDDEDAGDGGAAAPSEDLGVDIDDEAAAEEEDDSVPFLEDDEEDSFDEEIEGLPEEGDADER